MIREYFTLVFYVIWNVIQTILSAFQFVVSAFAALPTLIKVLLIAVIAVSVIYKVISLGGSGE